MKVKECMVKQTVCIKPETNIYEVAKLMDENHVGCLPICDNNGDVAGIVTDRDIVLRGIACCKDIKTTPISDIMTTKVVKTSPDTDLEDVADLMIKNQIRRLPVIDGNQIVGMITLGDFAKEKCMCNEKIGETFEGICCCDKKHQS